MTASNKEVLMARRFRFVGNLSPDSRIDRYQVSEDKVLERDGEAVVLTDNQYEKAVQYIQLEEVPEDATDAQYGPDRFPDSEADKAAREQAAEQAAAEAPRGEKQAAREAVKAASKSAEGS